VKEHLIDATKSGLYAVRRRAIEMLLPHLSDDDLFGLDHILADRSREPIKTFLSALLERDATRTASWLQQQKHFGEKATGGVTSLAPLFATHFASNVLFEVMTTVFQRGRGRSRVRSELLSQLVRWVKDDVQVWQFIREVALKDIVSDVRSTSLGLLANGQKDDPTTWHLIREAALKDTMSDVRSASLRLLANGQKDDPITWHLIREAALKDTAPAIRSASLELLANGQKDDPTTWYLIREAATKDSNSDVCGRACALLLQSLGCSELQRKLMSRDLYGYGPWHDPKKPITSARIAYAAQRLNLSVDEVRQQYEAIAAQLPVELILEWRKEP
jgi:hypothetical protein